MWPHYDTEESNISSGDGGGGGEAGQWGYKFNCRSLCRCLYFHMTLYLIFAHVPSIDTGDGRKKDKTTKLEPDMEQNNDDVWVHRQNNL